MRRFQITLVLCVALLAMASLATAQDTGIRDTIGIEGPIWGNYAVGDTVKVPIFISTDQGLFELSFVFDYESTHLSFIGAELTKDLGYVYFGAGELLDPSTLDVMYWIHVIAGDEFPHAPRTLYGASNDRQNFVNLYFRVLDTECCSLELDTSSSSQGSYWSTFFDAGGDAYAPEPQLSTDLLIDPLEFDYSIIQINCILDSDDEPSLPETIQTIVESYPNPFNGGTTIVVYTPTRQPVDVAIYDILGRRIRTLTKRIAVEGSASFEWDGRDDIGKPVASGIFFAKVVTNQGAVTRKLVLLK